MKNNIYINKIKEYALGIWNVVSVWLGKTASVKMKKKSYTIYPVKILVGLIALVIVISVIGAVFSGGGSAGDVEIPFEAGSPYRVYPADDGVMVYNNRGAKAIDEKGEIKWETDIALSEPMVDSAKDYVLFCDLAGNHYAASYKNGNRVFEYNLGNDIISAKITKKGYAAFATDTDGYKGKVSVFNKRGRELYVWNSGSGYITDIDLTDNGRYVAAAQLVGEEEEASTKIRFIDTRRGEVVGTAERKGEIAVSLKFVSDNKLIAVTDSNIIGYNKKGKELFCISLMGKSPSKYSMDSDNMMAVMTLDNRGNTVIEMYSYSGKFRGAYTATGAIRHMAVSGNRVVIAEQRGLVSISPRGKEKAVLPIEHDVIALGGYESGDSAIVIGSMDAEVIEIK
ncbi:MAG: DUF5711 family protein [Clostridia bacterium]|nr:DUF5711 family protein [Clostridia bacterium]